MDFSGSSAVVLARQEIDFFKLAVGILEEGAVQAKIQAAHFVCAFMYSCREIESCANPEMMSLLIETLELEEPDVCMNILELFFVLARRCPQCAEFLIEQQFEQYLIDIGTKLRSERVVEERLYRFLVNYHRNEVETS
jgi:hypothetical protein